MTPDLQALRKRLTSHAEDWTLDELATLAADIRAERDTAKRAYQRASEVHWREIQNLRVAHATDEHDDVLRAIDEAILSRIHGRSVRRVRSLTGEMETVG